MKRLFCAVLVILLGVFSVFSSAAQGEDIITVKGDSAERDFVSEYEEILPEDSEDIDSLFGKIIDSVRDYVFFFADKLSALIGIVLLVSVASSFFDEGSLASKCISFASSAVICTYVLQNRLIDVSVSKTLLNSLADISAALVPIETSLLISGQRPASAVLSGYSLKVVTTVVEYVISTFCLPLITSSLALTVASPVCQPTLKIADFFKKCAVAVTVTSMTIASFFLALRGTIASAADTVTMRSVKFAVGTFVPMVGGALSEAVGYVAGSFSYVKNTCGVMAITALLTIILPPVIKSVLSCITLSLASAVCDAFCIDTGKILSSLSSLATCLLVCEISSAMLFIIRITLFVKVGGS